MYVQQEGRGCKDAHHPSLAVRPCPKAADLDLTRALSNGGGDAVRLRPRGLGVGSQPQPHALERRRDLIAPSLLEREQHLRDLRCQSRLLLLRRGVERGGGGSDGLLRGLALLSNVPLETGQGGGRLCTRKKGRRTHRSISATDCQGMPRASYSISPPPHPLTGEVPLRRHRQRAEGPQRRLSLLRLPALQLPHPRRLGADPGHERVHGGGGLRLCGLQPDVGLPGELARPRAGPGDRPLDQLGEVGEAAAEAAVQALQLSLAGGDLARATGEKVSLEAHLNQN